MQRDALVWCLRLGAALVVSWLALVTIGIVIHVFLGDGCAGYSP